MKSVVLRCVCCWSGSTKKSVKSQLNLSAHDHNTLVRPPHIQLESCSLSNLDVAVGYIAIHQFKNVMLSWVPLVNILGYEWKF